MVILELPRALSRWSVEEVRAVLEEADARLLPLDRVTAFYQKLLQMDSDYEHMAGSVFELYSPDQSQPSGWRISTWRVAEVRKYRQQYPTLAEPVGGGEGREVYWQDVLFGLRVAVLKGEVVLVVPRQLHVGSKHCLHPKVYMPSGLLPGKQRGSEEAWRAVKAHPLGSVDTSYRLSDRRLLSDVFVTGLVAELFWAEKKTTTTGGGSTNPRARRQQQRGAQQRGSSSSGCKGQEEEEEEVVVLRRSSGEMLASLHSLLAAFPCLLRCLGVRRPDNQPPPMAQLLQALQEVDEAYLAAPRASPPHSSFADTIITTTVAPASTTTNNSSRSSSLLPSAAAAEEACPMDVDEEPPAPCSPLTTHDWDSTSSSTRTTGQRQQEQAAGEEEGDQRAGVLVEGGPWSSSSSSGQEPMAMMGQEEEEEEEGEDHSLGRGRRALQPPPRPTPPQQPPPPAVVLFRMERGPTSTSSSKHWGRIFGLGLTYNRPTTAS